MWLAPDRVYGAGGSYLSACATGCGCAPVIEEASCAPPECPGSGSVYRVSRAVVNVGGWPVDHDGYERALSGLQSDPALSGLPLVNHPGHAEWLANEQRAEEAQRLHELRRGEDVRWVNRYRENGERFELALSGSIATLTETGGTFAGATASLNFVHLLDSDDAEDEDDNFVVNFFFGDVMGAELRTHFLYRVDTAQEAEWITAIGVAPVFANRFEHSVVRTPTYLGTILPEVGLMLRADRDPTWYVAWDVPFSFLWDHDLAVDLVARFFVVDEWIELPADAPDDAEDPAEVILMLNLGFRLP